MKDSASATIRVLIVDDIPETRENLRKLLYFESDIEVVGTAVSGNDAVDQARQLKPDIVLMDINMPGLDGISAGEMISHDVPQAQIIMMSVQGEADYLRRSMLAGAREFLIKPFSSEELVSTIRRVYQLGATRRVAAAEASVAVAAATVAAGQTTKTPQRVTGGKVIAVYAPKGGVGCSTIAVNIAVALQEALAHSKVLLLDASLQFGGIDVLLNLQSPRTIVELAEKIDDLDTEFVNSVVASHASGVKVLLAPPRPEMADLVTAEHFGKLLPALRRMFDFVVVDMRSSLYDVELTILDAADRVILVTTPEIPSIKNAKLFFDVAHALDYPVEKTMMVINEADQKGGIRAEDIESSIRHPISATIPFDDRTTAVAVNQGVPLVLTHRTSTVAISLLALAKRVVLELQPAETAPAAEPVAPAKSSLLGKLFR